VIQGYVEDRALWRNSSDTLVSEADINQSVGYFDSSIKNFFSTPVCVIDNRPNRLTIFAQPLAEKMKLWFDAGQIQDEEPASNLTTAQWNFIFNIIEYVTYTVNVSVVDLETYIVAHPELFGTYNPNSLSISTNTTDVTCNLLDDTELSASVRRYLGFEYTSGAATVNIKVWIDNAIFATDYPLYVITKVVPPCNPSTFLNVTTASTISTIITAANYELPIMDTEITTNDHSGVYIYFTKFVNVNITSTFMVPFTIFYKGHQPSTISMRIAIREFLEAVEGIDPSVWPTIFPDLYTDTRVYIIPIWDNTHTLPTGTIYPSITLNTSVVSTVDKVFPALQPDFINEFACTLTCDSSSLTLVAIPDPDNTVIESLRTIHPTYRDMDATNAAFDTQTTVTRDFNIKLCNAVATLLGSTATTTSFVTLEEDGRMYLTFISNLIEYCVLYRTSFPV